MSALQGCVPCAVEANGIVEVESASVSDAETVQNTNTHNSSVEEETNDSELLNGLLTDTFCQVCEAVLLFESQRVSHYEGKKHAQRVRIYLQSKKTERNKQKQESCNFLSGNTDPEKFCELCNMVFSSPVVARSHYDGKVHAKNVKKSLANTSVDLKPAASLATLQAEPSREAGKVDKELKESVASTAPSVELSDLDKYCKLCAASFNNPLMAQQHYSGRKHLRNQSRQELLNQIGDESVNSLTCPVCCVTLSSVEMYQAHMQGNKHHIKEKKIHDLCQSQKKVYDSFQDELADYIQVQRARGLEPKTGQGSESPALMRKADEEEKEDTLCSSAPPPPPPPPPPLPLPLPPPAFHPSNWRAQFQPRTVPFGFRGRFPVQQWNHGYPQHPPPLIPGLKGLSQKRGRSPGSFSSYSSSASSSFSDSSSYSSSTTSSSSEGSSDYSRERRRKRMRKRKEQAKKRTTTEQIDNPEKDTEQRGRSKRKQRDGEEERGHAKKARREREGAEKDNERRKLRKMAREMDSEEEEEHRSRRRENKKRQRHKEGHQGNWKREGAEGERSKVDCEEGIERGGGGLQNEAAGTKIEELDVERTDVKEDRTKRKKEKKKTKKLDSGDNRTEEEKLWDATILGVF